MEQTREPKNRTTEVCMSTDLTEVQGNSIEERQLFQQIMLEHLDMHRQKYKTILKSHTILKNSKWCTHFNVKHKTIKVLGKKTKQKIIRI